LLEKIATRRTELKIENGQSLIYSVLFWYHRFVVWIFPSIKRHIKI
jgi:hypothetical protein